MNRAMKRMSACAALVLALFAWGCDSRPLAVEPELDPSPLVVTSTSGRTFVVAWERSPSVGSVSANIGEAGGVLVLGNHTLWVNPGAVSSVAKFTMSRDLENPLRVKLTAGRDGQENNVGSAGFDDDEVYVAISYDNASGVPADESLLEVLYFRPDGQVEEVASTVHWLENRVVAEISHFSLYGIGWP